MISKLIVSIVMNLHEIWIARYQVIHTKFADSVEVEERVDLMNDLK